MKTATQSDVMTQTGRGTIVLGLSALIFLLAVVLRIGLLNIAPEFDELYHLLAARSWINEGTLAILDGVYERGAYFTKAVAAVMGAFGEDLATGRLLTVLVGGLIPVVFFVWVNRTVGLAVALIVAAFTIVWPQGILEAQTMRFYAPQVLAYVIGASALFMAIAQPPSHRVVWGVIAIVAWAIALHLQITSAVGIAAALGAAYVIVLFDKIESLRGRIIAIGLTVLVGLLALAVTYQTGILEKAIAYYRWTPGHAERLRDYHSFYHHQFIRIYGILWWTTPVWALIALWAKPRIAFYALTIFFCCLVIHSFGGMKSLRYLSYASPMLFIVWAIAAVTIWQMIARRLGDKVASAAAVVAAIAVVAMTGFAGEALRFAQGEDYRPREDWRDARAVIGDWENVPFVATTRELHYAEYIGNYDIVVSRSRVTEIVPPVDFTLDFRTGRPAIGDATSIAAMFACAPDGMIVTTPQWLDGDGAGAMFAENLAEAGFDSERREAGTVAALRWSAPAGFTADCSGVPEGALASAS